VFLQPFLSHQVIRWDENASVSLQENLIAEEPLAICIQNRPYSVVMRTPGDEIAHVAGFCLTEGIVDCSDDFSSIDFSEETDHNVVTVLLKESRQYKMPLSLERQDSLSRGGSTCCGKEMVKRLCRSIPPLTDERKMDARMAIGCLDKFFPNQNLGEVTRASHAAALFSFDFDLLSVAEDVGRHNAIDKAIGKLLLGGNLQEAFLLVLSSRISYDLVQKAGRARIPFILAISRPTSLALQGALRLKMTVACLAKPKGLYVFCGEHRLGT
jgi:FdhD protein